MTEQKQYTIMCCDTWCRVEGLPQYSELVKALKSVIKDYEGVMHSEFDYPNDAWSPERDGNDDLLKAKDLISKLQGI